MDCQRKTKIIAADAAAAVAELHDQQRHVHVVVDDILLHEMTVMSLVAVAIAVHAHRALVANRRSLIFSARRPLLSD